MSEPERIDYSRYRVAAAIAELHAAGEGLGSIADTYFEDNPQRRWIVELVVAAHDRKDKYAGLLGKERTE